MAERDTYQLVLQLKDELTANLKKINSALNQTKVAGSETTKEVESFIGQMKMGLKPIRDFSMVMTGIMSFGGAGVVIKRIANAIGDMEKAYAKLHPESQTAIGSLASWNSTMGNMKSAAGEMVSNILTPIRAWFINIIEPMDGATRSLKNYNDQLREANKQFISSATKKMREVAEARAFINEQRAVIADAEKKLVSIRKQIANIPAITKEEAKLIEGIGPFDKLAQKQIEIIMKQREFGELTETLKGREAALVEQYKLANENVSEALKWLEEQLKPSKELTDFEKLLNEYLKENIGHQKVRLELAQEYMDVMDEIIAAQSVVLAGGKVGLKPSTGRAEVKHHINVGRIPGETEYYQRNQYSLEQEAKILTEINRQLVEYYGYKNIVETPLTQMAEDFKAARLDLLYDSLVGVAEALGQVAAGTKSFSDAMADMVRSILQTIGPLLIQKGLEIIGDNLALGLAMIAAGGLTLVGAGMINPYPNQGIENPAHMASGGIVSKPTLALLGEAGPEAVVPLNPYRRGAGGGYGGIGGVTIVAPNAQFLDGRIAAQLVRQGLSAMRS